MLAATNGHTLGVAHDPTGLCQGSDAGWICKLPKSICAKPPAKADWGNAWFIGDLAYRVPAQWSSDKPEDITTNPSATDAIAFAEAIDGKFPDISRIIRDFHDHEITGQDMTVNLRYLRDFERAVGLSYGTGIHCFPGQQHEVIGVRIPNLPEFAGFVMPLHFDQEQLERTPQWLIDAAA